MGIIQFIGKICVQTVVYWGGPVEDGFGQKVYASPREIRVRWTDKVQIIKSSDGKELTSESELLVQEDLDLQGLVYLGSLSEFTPLQLNDPISIVGVREILGKDKIPLIKSTTLFVRTVYLSGRSLKGKSF